MPKKAEIFKSLVRTPSPSARQNRPSQAVRPTHEANGGITYEADPVFAQGFVAASPDFLEHLHHEIFRSEQGQLLWDE